MYRTDATPDRSLLIVAFGGKVFAVDRFTGEQRWKTKLDDWDASVVELAIGPEVLIAVSSKRLAILRYASGELVKSVDRSQHERGIGRTVALIDGNFLYLGRYGSAACYTLAGEFVWEQYFSGEGQCEAALGFPGNVRQADDRGAK